MKWIKTILREIFGLFVDDAKFALSIILWVLLVRITIPRIHIAPEWGGIILFAGLALSSLQVQGSIQDHGDRITSDAGSSRTSARTWFH